MFYSLGPASVSIAAIGLSVNAYSSVYSIYQNKYRNTVIVVIEICLADVNQYFVTDARLLRLIERTWVALSVDQSLIGRVSFGRLLRQTNGSFHITLRNEQCSLCPSGFAYLHVN